MLKPSIVYRPYDNLEHYVGLSRLHMLHQLLMMLLAHFIRYLLVKHLVLDVRTEALTFYSFPQNDSIFHPYRVLQFQLRVYLIYNPHSSTSTLVSGDT